MNNYNIYWLQNGCIWKKPPGQGHVGWDASRAIGIMVSIICVILMFVTACGTHRPVTSLGVSVSAFAKAINFVQISRRLQPFPAITGSEKPLDDKPPETQN